MVKAAGEVGVDIITDLVNQVIVEGVILAEWELSTIVNCYTGKGGSLERVNCTGLKLADQILKIVERILDKGIRQQVDIDLMQFGFMPGCGTKNVLFTFDRYTGEIFN